MERKSFPAAGGVFTKHRQPLQLGGCRQLFLDDYCIEESSGLARTLHRPQKCGAVMVPDSEGGQVALQSRNAPQWNPEKRLWEWWHWGSWECEPYGPYLSTSTALVHYATSEDGVRWDKPDLGLFEWRGSRANNVAVDPERGHRSLYHVSRDEADPDPGRRYKGLFSGKGCGGRNAAVSADGFDWQGIEDTNIPSSDESNFCYDPFGEQYVAIVKRGTVWGRSMSLATSPDFQQWQDHGTVMHADQVDWDNRLPRILKVAGDPRYLSPPLIDEEDYIAETYNMAVFPYEGIYIGLVNLFNPAGAIPPPRMNHTGLNQVELAVSRNLRNWRRLCDREVFLGVEPWDGERYDTQQLLPAGPPVVRDDEIWVYYNACRFRGHKELYAEKYAPYFRDLSALALAKLRLDGFVSLDAADEGELVTKSLSCDAQALWVNADAAGGEVRAEVLDASTMAPLPGLSLNDCAPITEDTIRGRVAWREECPIDRAAQGRPVRIRFRLRRASLYSFWLE